MRRQLLVLRMFGERSFILYRVPRKGSAVNNRMKEWKDNLSPLLTRAWPGGVSLIEAGRKSVSVSKKKMLAHAG
jgi:hypothetical protein